MILGRIKEWNVQRKSSGKRWNESRGWKNEREAWCKHVAGSVRRGFERKEGGLSDGVNGGTRNVKGAREQRMVGGYNWWMVGRTQWGGEREGVWYGLWTASHGSVRFRSVLYEVLVCFQLQSFRTLSRSREKLASYYRVTPCLAWRSSQRNRSRMVYIAAKSACMKYFST